MKPLSLNKPVTNAMAHRRPYSFDFVFAIHGVHGSKGKCLAVLDTVRLVKYTDPKLCPLQTLLASGPPGIISSQVYFVVAVVVALNIVGCWLVIFV